MILRGGGADKTVLVIPKPLQEIYPKGPVDEFKSAYSFGGGFIEVSGSDRGKRLTIVSATAVRGACQVEQTLFVTAKRQAPSGHHALWATGFSQDCLFSHFDIRTQYVHDLTVEGFANGNVFMKGRGVALNFDHHRNAPYENLFTDLDAGNPKRLWASSGRGDRGPHAGARATFWNIRGRAKAPRTPDWPEIITVGVCVPLGSNPPNLFEAQRVKR